MVNGWLLLVFLLISVECNGNRCVFRLQLIFDLFMNAIVETLGLITSNIGYMATIKVSPSHLLSTLFFYICTQ